MLIPSAVVVTAAMAWCVGTIGGATAALYLGLFLLATIPGLPLGFALFGRRQAAGWIAGMLLGYVLTALVLWALVSIGRAGGASFVAGWTAATVTIWAAALALGAHGTAPLVRLPAWGRRETATLLLLLLLVPLLTTRPFSRVGSLDADGNRRIRAYFTADFVWHMALVAELEKHAQPPRNPFLAAQPIHYYWTYFLMPAAAGPLSRADTALALKINAVATSMLLLSAIFVFAWVCLPQRPIAVTGAVFLTVIAASAEGLAAIVYVLSRGEPLSAVRDLNVDAMSRGFGGLRIDDLPRAMWYTPQHAMAYAVGLMALPAVVRDVPCLPPRAILLAGTLLGASVLLNPFVGGLFCVVYGVGVLADAARLRPGAVLAICVRHALTLVPIGTALGWIAFNRIAEGAGGTLHLGWFGPATHAPIPSLLISLGPLLLLMGHGSWPDPRVGWRPAVLAFAGVVLCLLVMHLVTMTVDQFWVGFRMGHMVLVFAPVLVARSLMRLSMLGRRAALIVAALILLAGAPTTAIDAFNAQDVENDHMGPGFHWTVRITPSEQEALAWIRTHTRLEAIVQAEPTVRGRETWSFIPSFAERRMAAGEPISLMHVAEYDEATALVHQIYATTDVSEAWRLATELRIDYLYVDATERAAYPATAKFDSAPDRFPTVFRNSEVAIFAVAH